MSHRHVTTIQGLHSTYESYFLKKISVSAKILKDIRFLHLGMRRNYMNIIYLQLITSKVILTTFCLLLSLDWYQKRLCVYSMLACDLKWSCKAVSASICTLRTAALWCDPGPLSHRDFCDWLWWDWTRSLNAELLVEVGRSLKSDDTTFHLLYK